MYLSHLLKKPVQDSADAAVGRLKDILIFPRPGIYAPLAFLAVERRVKHDRLFIPYEFVATISGEGITLKHLTGTIPPVTLPHDVVWLARDILDQQIVDVEGARVVRVNDLKVAAVEDVMCVVGIDISWRGVLRRLGLSRFDIFNIFKVNLIDWRKAQPVRGVLKLDTPAPQLTTLHPADLANIIEDLTIKHGSTLVNALDSQVAAKVVGEMDPELQKTIIRYLGPERAAHILERMSIDEAVDLLKLMPRDKARQLLSFLQQPQSRRLEKLLPYPNDTAGGLMSLEFMQARPEWTVRETTEEVKRISPTLRSLLYIYITDQTGKFKGTVSLRRLLTASPESRLKEVMKKLPKNSLLRVTDHVDTVVKIMTKYNLYTAAVLDRENKLTGVLTIDDVMRYLVPHA